VLKVCRPKLQDSRFSLLSYLLCIFLSPSLSVSLSLGGPDFEQVSRTFTYPAESDTACTIITVVDDRVALEGAEQFIVELTLPPGQPSLQLGNNRQSTITITDNDGIHYTTANII